MRCILFLAAVLAYAQEPIPPLLDAGNAAYLNGEYEAARQAFLKAWESAQQTPPNDPIRYDILKRLTSVRAAAGEFEDADQFLQLAINWRETTNGQNDPKIVDELLLSVQLCRGMKNYDRALMILSRVMIMHRTTYGTETAVFADDLSREAQIQMEKKDVPAAVRALDNAIAIRTKAAGPLDPSLIGDLDRLAGAHIVLRKYDRAEQAYRRALVIRETLLGKNDADLIATVDGLAYACFGQKKFEDAEPLYQRLISLWVKSVGEDHPMVAIALDKVATFYAEQKKYDQAKEATERANAIRAQFLATGLSGAATEQIAEGNKETALGLYRRALAIMEPPHPIFEETRGVIEQIVKEMGAPPAKAPAHRPLTKK